MFLDNRISRTIECHNRLRLQEMRQLRKKNNKKEKNEEETEEEEEKYATFHVGSLASTYAIFSYLRCRTRVTDLGPMCRRIDIHYLR